MRFETILDKELIKELIPLLQKQGYQETKNPYPGENDNYIIIDTKNKTYMYIEGAFFANLIDMGKIDNDKTLAYTGYEGYW